MSDLKMPPEISKILENMDFISMIKPGYKVNISTKTFSEPNSYLAPIYRRINGDSNEKTILFIEEIIEEANNILDSPLDKKWVLKVYEALRPMKVGVLNLLKTYYDKPGTLTKINICVNKIDCLLEYNSTKH